MEGPPGATGPKGEQGDLGPAPVVRRRSSAFTVVRSSTQTGSPGDVLHFPTAKFNIGNDFDVSTGIFTCKVAGIYSFQFHISFDHNSETVIQLIKDGGQIVSIYRDREAGLDIASNGATLPLSQGDQVWLRFANNRGTVFSNDWEYTSFSGVLVQEM